VVRTALVKEIERERADSDDCGDGYDGTHRAGSFVQRYDLPGGVNDLFYIGNLLKLFAHSNLFLSRLRGGICRDKGAAPLSPTSLRHSVGDSLMKKRVPFPEKNSKPGTSHRGPRLVVEGPSDFADAMTEMTAEERS